MKKEKKVKVEDSTLEDALKSIRDQFGKESIMMLNEKPNVDIDAISTQSIGLDYALGIGGLPKGRIIEIYGAESSGKTTLSLHVIAEAQKKGLVCAFVDAEHGMDPQYAKKLGVITDHLLISQPDNGEEALRITNSLIKTGKIGVIVVDSVAALTPKSEIDGEIGNVSMGTQARLMSQAMRMLVASIDKTNTIVVFINQTRQNIGGYGDPTTTAGGKALKFYSSVRIEIKKIATIKKGDDAVGSRVRVKVVKNKVACPFKQAEFDIVFGEGIVKEAELLGIAEKFDIISKAGASYSFGEVKLGRGFDSAITFLKENKEVAEEIEKIIRTKFEA